MVLRSVWTGLCLQSIPCVKTSCGGNVLQGPVLSVMNFTDLQLANPENVLPHNHASEDAEVRLAKIRNTMKSQAVNTRDKPAQILAQPLGQCDDDVRALMTIPNAIKGILCNQRPTPPIPKALQDLWMSTEHFTF